MKRICVYCGSSIGADPAFVEVTRSLARALAATGTGLVYGGGAIGLMGALATAYIEAGGPESIGVIPQPFGRELVHPGLTVTHMTRTMHERKQLMFDLSDGFIALPGGTGTVEELMEVWTWARERAHDKPIGLLDAAGYYEPLLVFLERMVASGFCPAEDRELVLVDVSAERLLRRMWAYTPRPVHPRWARVEPGAQPPPGTVPVAGTLPAPGTQPVADIEAAADAPPPTVERFDPSSPAFIEDPHPFYRRYRERDPVHFGLAQAAGQPGCWYLFRHDDIAALLRDPRFVRRWPPRDPRAEIDAAPEKHRRFLELSRSWLLGSDPPDHTRLRSSVNRTFSPRIVDELRPRIQDIAFALADEVERKGTFDVVHDFAVPLSFRVIAEILGVDAADIEQIRAWSNAVGDGIAFRTDGGTLERASEAVRGLTAYFRPLIDERSERPRGDLLSLLAASRDAGDALSEVEVLAMCCQLVFAGHETTASHIASGALALLRHPDQRRLLEERPDLAESAANELMRFESPVQTAAARRPVEDVEIRGKRIRAGEPIIAFLGAANRDPALFADPDRLDITRSGTPHLSFGGGIHACLGMALARAEGAIALRALFGRLRGLRLAGEHVRYRPHAVLRGPLRVLVAIERGPAAAGRAAGK